MNEEPETLAPQGPASAAGAAESLADIVREMRDLAHGFANGEVCATARKVRQWVSRIEAAAKQEEIDAELKWTRIGYDERKAEEKRTPGNVAAMREALEKVHKAFCDGLIGAHGIATDAEAEALFRLWHTEIPAALAAPPRNCDRFATPAEAHIAFQRFCRGNYRQGYAAAGLDGCDDCELCETKNTSGEDACPFAWLFAPENGGNKQ